MVERLTAEGNDEHLSQRVGVNSPGWIEVIAGSMFSGKSEELIRRLRRARIARLKVQVFKPDIDDRYSKEHIVSHSEMRHESRPVRTAAELLEAEAKPADFYVGLEGGFHSITFDGERRTFLHGWAYASDGARGYFGHAPAVTVPASVVARVEQTGRELGEVIDEVAGEHDVRSRQGAWGVLSRGLFTRAASFETALVAAFAPFYNARLYA